MRRPSPLPPPSGPGAPSRSAPDVAGAGGDVAEAVSGARAGDVAPEAAPPTAEGVADALAPVISITAPTALPPAAAVAGTAPSADEAGPAAGEGAPAVGFRDVWRATRARRRALRAEVRRFTGRQRRRRMLWLGAAGALVLLVLGTVGAAYSPLFAVEDITVLGAESLDAGEVEQALSDQLGTPLAAVDESAVKAALVGFPLVESYTLEARPPHELVVRIVERTPIGVVQSAAGYTLVDAAGVALSTSQDPPAGWPVLTVSGGTGSAAFGAVGTVMRSLPDDIRARVTAVSASTADDVTLTLGDTATQVFWGSAEDSAMKALGLQTIMASRPPADVSVYDVSSPTAIVVR